MHEDKQKKRDCTVQGRDAADCGAVECAVAFDKRVVGWVVDLDVIVDGGARAKFAARVPFPQPQDLPSREDGVQSFSCCLLSHNKRQLFLNQTTSN